MEIRTPFDWNNPGEDKLWLYNLHYFDDLNSTDAESRHLQHTELIGRWIKENPPFDKNGWDPYPLSLRIVNWIKWSLQGNQLSNVITDSLALQIRHLRRNIEYHLLGNHLFENAKALIFGGLYFEGKEAKQWLLKGSEILQKELNEQILPDGGHFELSPMYHSIILEGLLDLLNLSQVYPGCIDPSIIEALKKSSLKMRTWYQIMCHPDGQLSFFNDATLKIASERKSIEDYAVRLGFSPQEEVTDNLVHLRESGYARSKRGRYFLLADVGKIGPNYIPGHAHADSLSFELSIDQSRVIVNSGISCYGTSRERLIQRGTAAHNTIVIDGKNSSEIWGGFRVAKRASITTCDVKNGPESDVISACHNGYLRIPKLGNHCRYWNLRDCSIEIIDIIEGHSNHDVQIPFHFFPGIRIEKQDGSVFNILNSNGCQLAILKGSQECESAIKDGFFFPEFGKAEPNKRVVFKLTGDLPIKLRTTIVIPK